MDKWQSAEWLAFVAIVVAVIGVGIAVWAARRWGTRRAKLLFAHSSTALLPEGAATNNSLVVSYNEFPVPNPHLVTLTFKNIGPRDIRRDDFDAGKSLRADLGSTMYGFLKSESGEGIDLFPTTGAIGSPAVVEYGPALIPRGSTWTTELLVSGKPTPRLTGRPADTDIVEGDRMSSAVIQALNIVWGGITITVGGAIK